MTSKRFIYFIVSAFITGNLLLILLQYNSAKNINDLVYGNEKLLDEFKVGNQLRDLEKDVISIESRIRGMIVTKDTSHISGLALQINETKSILDQLQTIRGDNISTIYVDKLDSLVRQKLELSKRIVDTFYYSGKLAAEALMGFPKGRQLTEAISQVIQQMDSNRQLVLFELTSSIDRSGQEARKWGAILIVVVLLSGAGLFWYIINRIRHQNELINQLDSSEKKVREAARVKENFMANMSHEIRTPMNAILGFTGLMQKKPMDAESKEYLYSIQRSGENLLTIINDILDLSKIEAGMMRIESAPFSIRDVVGFIELMFAEKAAEKKLSFITTIDPDTPDLLEGDAVRLTQILVNLVGNAIKFTQRGEVRLYVGKRSMDNKKLQLEFVLTDTGIGIHKEQLPYIFERFQQAEDSITRNYGGTGLGLSIVNELIHLQNGEINVESEAGKGTSFSFMLPYMVSEKHDSIEKQAVPVNETSLTSENVRILVVEDNEMNQRLMEHLLKGWKLNIAIASNGKEAMDKLSTEKYDLILMDIQMPEMDGYTATQLIRQAGITIPVIAMTAHAWAGEKEKCLNYGMDDYLSKPIKEEELSRLISRYTTHQKMESGQPVRLPATDIGTYQYINLQYMKQVSGGDKEYERVVTEQFLEIIPEDLERLSLALQKQDLDTVHSTAHNMKTSISIMGLSEKLQACLDKLEESADPAVLAESLTALKTICLGALEEARHFHAQFQTAGL